MSQAVGSAVCTSVRAHAPAVVGQKRRAMRYVWSAETHDNADLVCFETTYDFGVCDHIAASVAAEL